jgi:hypothetical protein
MGLFTRKPMGGQPFLSSLVLGEGEPDEGMTLARELVDSFRSTKPVQRFAPSPETAYARLLTVTERPFVGSVHWPIIPWEQFVAIGPIDVECAAGIVWEHPA